MAPRVLHFNDCAFVARSLVSAAARMGLHWDYLPPTRVRPTGPVEGSSLRRAAVYLPYWTGRVRALSTANVAHVHYATSVRLLRDPGVPKRPYILTLHGTDIRRQWKDPHYHSEIQRAVDEAEHVFYANTDNRDDALAARSDAEFFPSVVDLPRLPSWQPEDAPPQILFVSRWDADKGVDRQLELAESLVRAVGDRARIVGVNWGPGAIEAERRGVRLLDRLPQEQFHEVMARSHLAIGQASNYFSTSEFEALCMGLPMAALGSRLGRPDDSTVPPVMEGSVEDVTAQVLEAIGDPLAAAVRLGSSSWARPRYDAAVYVDRLDRLYRDVGSTD
jgi:glycosyltransferase involved in cell wall biosynthesis